jgi:hypothetical protein
MADGRVALEEYLLHRATERARQRLREAKADEKLGLGAA